MQCKDIADIDILTFLHDSKERSGMWANRVCEDDNDVRHAFPDKFETPHKLVLAKMGKLIQRGLVDGCACGCRGDFTITPKGLEYLARNTEAVPSWATLH